MFREQDKVTKWVNFHIRGPLAYHDRLVQAMLVARFINRPETLDVLKGIPRRDATIQNRSMICYWSHEEVRHRLQTERPGQPIVTGAYMVKTPLRKPKLEGLSEIFEPIMSDDGLTDRIRTIGTLQGATEELCKFPWVGPFMAYEVVSDLRHTPVLRQAPDILTWANPGPGATRGLGRVFHANPDHFSRGNSKDVLEMYRLMQVLLKHSQRAEFWPRDWPAWEMREVEHWLCEFDKYERARLGEGAPKQLYKRSDA